MELNYSPEEQQFREEVREFLAHELPPVLARKGRLGLRLTRAEHVSWHAKLNQRGWLAGNWPQAFGGAAWSPVQRHIFEDEMALAFAPRIVPFGVAMLGPVLQKFGSAAQQQFYLPRILSGEHWWCQGYSEPGAGSDLASLRTSAVLDGDHYVVNGQKTWTTLGQHANWMFCLVRTDKHVKAQAGISFLLIDMNSPGVTVRPIVLIDGSAEVNEVFFDQVRVPLDNLVGEENNGWTYAKYLLNHERTNIAGVGFSKAGLSNLKAIASAERDGDTALIDNPMFAARVAQLEIDLMALSTTNSRMLARASAGHGPGPESSMLKIKGTDIRQRITDLSRRAAGPYAMAALVDEFDLEAEAPGVGPDYSWAVTAQYFNNRKLSIFGGSNEIQRSIISKTLLEL